MKLGLYFTQTAALYFLEVNYQTCVCFNPDRMDGVLNNSLALILLIAVDISFLYYRRFNFFQTHPIIKSMISLMIFVLILSYYVMRLIQLSLI